MKIMTLLLILGMICRALVLMPSSSLPEFPVMGTEPLEERHIEKRPAELRYMSQKMYYLKTGRLINSEINRRKQQNYWGKGIPTNVRFPSHLAMWEETRRTERKRRF